VVEVVPGRSDSEVAAEVVRLLEEEGVVIWKELVERFRGVVSAQKLRKILAFLASEGKLVELPCRVFASPSALGDRERLRAAAAAKIEKYGVRKCGKNVLTPDRCVQVYIPRATGRPAIVFNC